MKESAKKLELLLIKSKVGFVNVGYSRDPNVLSVIHTKQHPLQNVILIPRSFDGYPIEIVEGGERDFANQ